MKMLRTSFITLILILVMISSSQARWPFTIETSLSEGGGSSWLISPGVQGETIQFKARLLDGSNWVDWDNIGGTPKCTVTFSSDLVQCGSEGSLSFDYVSSGSDGWIHFEIEHPMGIHVDALGIMDIDVEITHVTDYIPGIIPIRTEVHETFFAQVYSADYNADTVVNLADIGLFATAWVARDANYDLNGDGILDLADIGRLTVLRGESCNSTVLKSTGADLTVEEFIQEYLSSPPSPEVSHWGSLKAMYR
jgi:hypothetical protein